MRISEILFEARIYNQDYLNGIIIFYSDNLPQQAKEFIKRIIIKAAQDQKYQRKPILKPDATEWDKKDLANGTLVDFKSSSELRDKLSHIRDWLRNPEITEQELNSLRGIQDIDIAYEHADRFFDRLNKKASSDEDESGLETIMTWPDGFKLVKLNTAKCLNREGKLMQHCVGSYADKIESGTEILSLRDQQNNPHVTIEKRGNNILQIKGKNNTAPIEKYHQYILDYLNKNNFDEIRDLHNLKAIETNKGLMKLNNISEDTIIYQSITIWEDDDVEYLPKNLLIHGSLILLGSKIKKISENIKVTQHMSITNCKNLKEIPADISIGYELNINSYNGIEHLPDFTNLKSLKIFDASLKNLKLSNVNKLFISKNSNIDTLEINSKLASVHILHSTINKLKLNKPLFRLEIKYSNILNYPKKIETIDECEITLSDDDEKNHDISSIDYISSEKNVELNNVLKYPKEIIAKDLDLRRWSGGHATIILPEKVNINRMLVITNSIIPIFFEKTKQYNNLVEIYSCIINKIPEGIIFNGGLILNNSLIRGTFKHITVHKFLDISSSSLTELDDSVNVYGDIYVNKSFNLDSLNGKVTGEIHIR